MSNINPNKNSDSGILLSTSIHSSTGSSLRPSEVGITIQSSSSILSSSSIQSSSSILSSSSVSGNNTTSTSRGFTFHVDGDVAKRQAQGYVQRANLTNDCL